MADRTQLTPERLAELRRIAEAATPGPWEVTEFAGGEERSPGELGVFAPNHPHSYQKSDGTWYAVVICRGMDGPTREENSEYIAAFDPPTVLALLDEIDRLRRERETLAAAVRAQHDRNDHIAECDQCSFDLCPTGGELSYRAKRALVTALALLDGEKGGGADE